MILNFMSLIFNVRQYLYAKIQNFLRKNAKKQPAATFFPLFLPQKNFFATK